MIICKLKWSCDCLFNEPLIINEQFIKVNRSICVKEKKERKHCMQLFLFNGHYKYVFIRKYYDNKLLIYIN